MSPYIGHSRDGGGTSVWSLGVIRSASFEPPATSGVNGGGYSARANAVQNHLNVSFDVRDALSDTPDGTVADAVVSNPPYIPESEAPQLHSRVTRHEPAMALFVSNDDPLCFYKALQRWCEQGGLREGGWLAVECHTKFASDVAGLLASSGGWKNVEMLHDLQGLPRHVLAQRALP